MNKTFLRPKETGRYKIWSFVEPFKIAIAVDCADGWLVSSGRRLWQWPELWRQGDVESPSNSTKLSGCRSSMSLNLTVPTSFLKWEFLRFSPWWGLITGSALLQHRSVISYGGRWYQPFLGLADPVAPIGVLPVPASVACCSPALSDLLSSVWVLLLSFSCSPRPKCLGESVVSTGRPAHNE